MSFRKATGLLCVLALSVVAGCSVPEPELTKRDPTPGVFHFTAMTFNVHKDRSDDEETLRAVGIPNADIVCLQEITAAWEGRIRERYAERYPYMLFAPKENAGGLAILSRFPLEDLGVIPVPGDLHPAWHAVATTPSGKLQLMNVHLRSMFNGDSNFISNYFSTSEDHVMEIELFMSRALPDMPTLVLGDFNESPRGDAVRWLEDRGYRNALHLFHPRQNTWRGKFLLIVIKMTIDHIMFDSSIEPLDAWTDWRGASDHYPVVAHLEVPAWRTTVAPAMRLPAAPKRDVERDDAVLDLDDPSIDVQKLRSKALVLPDPPR